MSLICETELLSVCSLLRRRPGEEREERIDLRARRPWGSRHPCHNHDSAWQSMRNSGLRDLVGGVAQCAIGVDGVSIRVRVYNLRDSAQRDECAAEKAEHHPQQVVFLQITVAPQHKGLHRSCVVT